MSTKTNANAHAIISNMNKFKIGDGYTYKDICMICKIKEYKSGSNSRNKQMGTFNELFNIEEILLYLLFNYLYILFEMGL